jgi:hypothetical protein
MLFNQKLKIYKLVENQFEFLFAKIERRRFGFFAVGENRLEIPFAISVVYRFIPRKIDVFARRNAVAVN